MATINWIGGTGRYNVTTNWQDSGSLPQSGDTAAVGLDSTVQIRPGDDPTKTSFVLTFDIGDSQTFGAASDSNLSLANNAISGSLKIASGVTIDVTRAGGSISSLPPAGATVILGGIGVGGSVDFKGTINVGAGDSLAIGIASNDPGQTGYFDNAGTINVDGSGAGSDVNYAFAQIKPGNSSGNSTTGASAYYGTVNLSYGVFYAKATDDGGAFWLSNRSELAVVAQNQLQTAAVHFQDATDSLLLGQVGTTGSAQYLDNGQISGFTDGDTIGLLTSSNGSTPIAHAVYTVSVSTPGTGTLEFTDANNDVLGSVTLSGNYGGWTFTVTDTGSAPVSGYADEYAITATPCFCAGTLIATEGGEVAVEDLRMGDLVATVDGPAKPIGWIGRRTVAAPFADPVRCWPIRVKAGALGEGVPARDLLLSPDHALLVEHLLIQAGALVNGTSIVRESMVPRSFIYYHVELADHSLIFAERAPAETFVDNTDRMGFDNWVEHRALFPDGKPVEEMPWPRAKARRQVPAHVRAALDARAAEPGFAVRSAA